MLAAYTYSSGLRAPALIAFVKDTLIYMVIIVAVIYIPIEARRLRTTSSTPRGAFDAFNADNATPSLGLASGGHRPAEAAQWAYATLALGSALALFMYPHSLTGVLALEDPRR